MNPPLPTAPPAPSATRAAIRPLWSVLRWVLFVVVLAFVAYALWNQIAQLDWRTVRFRPLPVLGAALCLLAVPPVQLISYRTLLGAYAHTPPLRAMAAVAWIPPLGKYVPGKVASIVGAVYLLRRFNIPGAIALGVVLVMDGIAVLTGLITGSPLLLWEPVNRVLPGAWLWSAILIVVGVVCLHPAVFARLLNLLLTRTGRTPLQSMPDLKQYLVPVICGFAQWILAGLALWCLVNSVSELPASRIPLLISIAGLGYTISYLMLFAPGGLGPREAIFQLALAQVVAAPLAAVAVVMMRIVQTLTELTAALVGVAALRQIERVQRENGSAPRA